MHAGRVHLPRYRLFARWYDFLSLERPLYRGGRLAAIDLADVRPGDRVLDVGCGTGLSLPPLVAAVGPAGHVTGLEPARRMISRARARTERHGWSQVDLVRADANAIGGSIDGPFDVVLFCYSLSIVSDWADVWNAALGCLAPGGRIAVADTDLLTGWRRALNPLVRILLFAGGVRPERQVWEVVARDSDEIGGRDLRGGHVHVRAGMLAS